MYQTFRPLERNIAETEALRYQTPKSIRLTQETSFRKGRKITKEVGMKRYVWTMNRYIN